MCQVLQLCTLVLRYHMIQQHPLSPVQVHRFLHQLHTVVYQGAACSDHRTVITECNILLSCHSNSNRSCHKKNGLPSLSCCGLTEVTFFLSEIGTYSIQPSVPEGILRVEGIDKEMAVRCDN